MKALIITIAWVLTSAAILALWHAFVTSNNNDPEP